MSAPSPPTHPPTPPAHLQVLEWTLLNSTVALVGYYFAAFTIDRPWMGRTRMQSMGFAWMGELPPAGLKVLIHKSRLIHTRSARPVWGGCGPGADSA